MSEPWKNKKIAIIGNMNNNGFSLMRYFRDLGADAHLFTFSNDGSGSLSHFCPEGDTWEIEKWEPFIHYTKIENSYRGLLGDWKKLRLPPSKKYLKNLFLEYDYFIGSGLSPAILARIGLRLDIFFPYEIGIEFIGNFFERNKIEQKGLFKRILYSYLAWRQKKSVLNAKYCFNAEMGLTKQEFEKIGKAFLPYAVPMVYCETIGPGFCPQHLDFFLEQIKQFDFLVFNHARLQWVHDKKNSLEEWDRAISKHNDWLIKGFAKFYKSSRDIKVALVLLEYGPDVDATKNLCTILGVDSQVIWVPKSPRKELMQYLLYCDVGVGEFYKEYGTLWGGTGWEVMAAGKPLLQGANFTAESFNEMFGYPYPPLLEVASEEDVYYHLVEMLNDARKKENIGAALKQWFNTYNGYGLARKWLTLLCNGKGATDAE